MLTPRLSCSLRCLRVRAAGLLPRSPRASDPLPPTEFDDVSSGWGVVVPIDLVRGKLSRPSEPPLHGRETDVKRASHRSHRSAVPHPRDHRPPPLLPPPSFLLIAFPSHGFPPSIATEQCWHLADREVVALGWSWVNRSVRPPECSRTLQLVSPLGGGGSQSSMVSAFVVPAWGMLPVGVWTKK